jgi:membrane protein DedA with SNARE-associated domain/membrane-associated phospholipid phosphatase
VIHHFPVGLLASIADRILSLPGWLVLSFVFLLPSLEASAFVGFLFPGEIAVILGGVVASQGRVPLWAVIAAAVSGAIIGDSIGYLVGRRWGTQLLHGTVGRLPLIHRYLDKHLDSARDYVRQRRGRAVFFGRFTAALRVLVPGLAGMADVHYPTFLLYNVAGGLLWGTGFAVLGYVAGANYHRAELIASRVGLILLAVVAVGFLASRLMRRLAARSAGLQVLADRLAETRPIVWVRRRFARQEAWILRRLDPDSPRGSWLTFTIVVIALAAWAFGALTQDVLGHDEVALLDPHVETWVIAHRTGWLTSVVEAVTWMGSTTVIVPASLVIGSLFVLRRRDWRPSTLLAAAVAGAFVLANIVKPLVDRPRPSSAIWIGRYAGASFPSAHATQSIAFYSMLAVVLGLGSSPRTRTLLWSGAVLVVLVVGASRIYLGAHWMSDVLGGFALGAMWVAVLLAITISARSRGTDGADVAREAKESRPAPD